MKYTISNMKIRAAYPFNLQTPFKSNAYEGIDAPEEVPKVVNKAHKVVELWGANSTEFAMKS
jgi:hypothetical protein